MLLVYLVLWFIFNEHITLELLIIGILMCAVADIFSLKIICRRHPKMKTLPKLVWEGIKYCGFLLKEIFIANFSVIKLIVSPSQEVEPELHTFSTALQTNAAKVALANSITVTPGTITCTLTGNILMVHALDSGFAEGIENTEFEKRLLKMEEISRGNDTGKHA